VVNGEAVGGLCLLSRLRLQAGHWPVALSHFSGPGDHEPERDGAVLSTATAKLFNNAYGAVISSDIYIGSLKSSHDAVAGVWQWRRLMDSKVVPEPITNEKPRELTEPELEAVHGGRHAVTEKPFKGSPNAYAPGAWGDSSPPPPYDT
jgi:hypothetical protein